MILPLVCRALLTCMIGIHNCPLFLLISTSRYSAKLKLGSMRTLVKRRQIMSSL